jgi:hypothetical protein
MADNDHSVLIQFERSPNYKIVPADGAWGGPTPRGHVLVNFFVDIPVSPLSVTHGLTGDGQLGPELERQPSLDEARPRVSREFEIGVLLSPEDAEGIARWLLEQVELIRGEVEDEDEEE